MDDQLFTVDVCEPDPHADPGLSYQRRLTVRQQARLAQGLHPLSVLFGHIPLHPNAAPADDREAPGPRCRNCLWRKRHSNGYWKCFFGRGLRISSSSASDTRGWWPACRDYEAK